MSNDITPDHVIIKWLDRGPHDRERIAALEAELATYRSVVVPRAEYDRALQRAEQAERASDALVRDLQDARDARAPVALSQALDHLQAVMTTLAREASGPADVRVRDAARAFLVEQGRRAQESEAYRQATEEWEGKR